MPAVLVDTHCHLDLEAFDNDRDEVVSRAAEQGVAAVIVPAVDFASIPHVIALVEKYSGVYAAVGIHPNDVPSDVSLAEARARLQDAAAHPKVVAIGEIGLDYHWQATPHNVQAEWLKMQLNLASELALPVILHNRESTNDILDIVTHWARNDLPDSLSGKPGVMHSISASWPDVETVLAHGFYVGFTGPLTYKNAGDMRVVAENAAADRILVETDGPYLSPVPHRGKRNEPAYVRLTAEKLAEARGISIEQIGEQTTHNAERLFGITIP